MLRYPTPVSRSRYPGGGAAPVPALFGTIPADNTPGAFLRKQLRHSPGGAGPPGPLPGSSGRITGSARAAPDPAPYGRGY